MHIPEKPPEIHELIARHAQNPEALVRIYGGAFSMGAEFFRYRHWDKIRRVEPVPAGYTREEWWLVLKLGRISGARVLPLIGVDGVGVSINNPPEAQALLSSIDRRLGTESNLFPAQSVPVATREEFLLKALFDESITSSQIEGAVTTREDARAMLAARREPRTKHERMIANNYAAIRFIREHASAPLTPEFLLEIHRRITAGTLDHAEQEGRFRRDSDKPVTLQDFEGNTIFTPPPPAELPDRVVKLCAFANENPQGPSFLHPILRAILLHFWLAYEHPFVDGNGRTARALFYWSMLHSGYPLVEHISISEVILKHSGRYYESFLHAESDDNDATYFLINQLEMLDKAIGRLYEHIETKRRELDENAHRLANLPDLNHRQIALLIYGMKHPGTAYTIAAHEGFHAINTATARRDLLGLVARGLLIKGGKQGRAHTFIVPADLKTRLETARPGARRASGIG